MQRLIHNYKYKFKKFQIKNFNINVLVGKSLTNFYGNWLHDQLHLQVLTFRAHDIYFPIKTLTFSMIQQF